MVRALAWASFADHLRFLLFLQFVFPLRAPACCIRAARRAISVGAEKVASITFIDCLQRAAPRLSLTSETESSIHLQQATPQAQSVQLLICCFAC
jgi:hypothetical protein